MRGTLVVPIASALLVSQFGCVASPFDSPSSWPIEQAERRFREGDPESALRRTEHEIQQRYSDPGEDLVKLHVEILEALDRHAEATAFRGFVDWYASGSDTTSEDTEPSWRECRRSGPLVRDLVSSWGSVGPIGPYDLLESLAATFEIDDQGAIGRIEVIRAEHPGAAWMIIRSVADARISPSRLAERKAKHPESFPVSLCVWWTPEYLPNPRFLL